MVTLLVGDFTFLDIEIDGKFKAILNRIDKCFRCDSIDEAEKLGEDLLSDYESYLVPESYNGTIDLTQLESVGQH